eukprot:GGOE01028173.1.p1 GENE.GGOE01028173.1~~GGOE01028173.1.p1  ORF type:complete len:1194 (-),score=380.68 GGOE01028173.1:340-3654(-)
MANIHTLLDTEDVLLLAGVVGSDLVAEAKPLILQRGVPLVGATTGTAELRTPFHREFVNVRASFADEMVAHALFLVQYARVQRIACLYQNDAFGLGSYTALVAALGNVGIELVASGTYTHGMTDVEGAVEVIAGATQKAQAVVMAALPDAAVRFIPLLLADSRTDRGCLFTLVSSGWGSAFSSQLPVAMWPQVYFLFVVPIPGDPDWDIAAKFATSYAAAGNVPEPTAFEGYITGRLIVEVLRRTRCTNLTRAVFLDEVYTDQLFVLDDLVLGLYSDSYRGCSQALCACNAGLRGVFAAQLDPATATLGSSISTVRYSMLECSNPVTSVTAPLLFGQLLPSGDAGWNSVAVQVGRGIARAFAEANAAGGAGGREFVLLQQNYSSNTTLAINEMSNRYPLVALLGSVVPSVVTESITTIGTFHTTADSENAPFVREHIHLQPATSLELMALAQWAVLNCAAVHLRAPASATGQELLGVMTESVQSFQVRAASTATFSTGSDVLSSTQSGCVIAVGSDADMLVWYDALSAYPDLQLLTLSAPAMRLMAVWPNASSASHASRLHFPTLITGKWNTTVPATDPGEAWKYGYVLGQAVVQALTHSQFSGRSHTTSAELLSAWYTVKVMTSGTVTLGPYYGSNCTAGQLECECSEGVHTLAIRSMASTGVQSQYSISTCHVAYTAFQTTNSGGGTTWVIVGAVVGLVGVAALGVPLVLRLTRRNNATAPKDTQKPFCVLFTDIQASTHLWATLPDIMAHALSMHHALIRKLIAQHKCYEVKTIGDSFMCAVHTPQQAVRLALAIQTALYDLDWGTDAIDAIYYEILDPEDGEVGAVSRSCWNGLRVRVGIHYGLGDIQLDPVTKGYDYYGTVVNTAARIESICHGGQVGVSQEVYEAVRESLPDVVWADLGPQPLRGLTEPIRLHQALPAGPLAFRTFPPLRLHKQDMVPEVEGQVEIVTAVVSRHSSFIPSGKMNSVAPRGSIVSTNANENWQWVETHPLVLRGNIAAEELKQHFSIVYATLSTLLTTQTERFREQMMTAMCQRLHVPNYGVQGPSLQRTLRGVTHRVLPATVVNTQQQLQKGCLSPHTNVSSQVSPAMSLRATSFRHL